MRAREFIRDELDVYPIAGQEYDPHSLRTDVVGGGASKKLGPGTASVQALAMTSPDIDPTRTDKNVSANYALPIGSGSISGGVTRTAGLPNNQYNIQGNVPVGSGNFSAGVSGVKGQPNNFNLGYSRPVGPGQLDFGVNKQAQGGPSNVQARYTMPFEEELDEQQLDELNFLGSECTKDCSGHRAGYEWSKRKGLRQANSWSPSFNKGAGLAVAGK
jgi:hypothetical protein